MGGKDRKCCYKDILTLTERMVKSTVILDKILAFTNFHEKKKNET